MDVPNHSCFFFSHFQKAKRTIESRIRKLLSGANGEGEVIKSALSRRRRRRRGMGRRRRSQRMRRIRGRKGATRLSEQADRPLFVSFRRRRRLLLLLLFGFLLLLLPLSSLLLGLEQNSSSSQCGR